MTSISKLSTIPKGERKKNYLDDAFPMCAVGSDHCKKPPRQIQIFTSFCDNCGKECHEDCGELLDVPHKFLGDEPGFYCIVCIRKLPRSLYPKIPKDGVPLNIPKSCDDGSALFEMFMVKRKKLLERKLSKKKSLDHSFKYTTHSSKTRVSRLSIH